MTQNTNLEPKLAFYIILYHSNTVTFWHVSRPNHTQKKLRALRAVSIELNAAATKPNAKAKVPGTGRSAEGIIRHHDHHYHLYVT